VKAPCGAVQSQIEVFKTGCFGERVAVCERCGRLVFWDGAEVDHMPPATFALIVEEFVDPFEVLQDLMKPSRSELDVFELLASDEPPFAVQHIVIEAPARSLRGEPLQSRQIVFDV
jgi:hypothetical protein